MNRLKITGLDKVTHNQIQACLDLFYKILGDHLSGVYLYGSAISGGLQKFSDIDLFIVSDRNLAKPEKQLLVQSLLSISGIHKKSEARSIEATFVNIHHIKPWRYPPVFDFQYGEWLREEFECGQIELGGNKEMPDLAILITQVLLNNHLLFGEDAKRLLPQVPQEDLFQSMRDELEPLISNIQDDTTNVLLTMARIWSTLETSKIHSKQHAASLISTKLPMQHKPIIDRAKSIYLGVEDDCWEGLVTDAKKCCAYMAEVIAAYHTKA